VLVLAYQLVATLLVGGGGLVFSLIEF